ncbi:MAG TPA: hypothetical protein DHS57_05725 [Erysipelotrichaceae bacterium]|nr:hypothetical protein [Erysipelotrichaceae bacterium]
MKKLIKLLLSITIAFTALVITNKDEIKVNAAVEYNLYPMHCSAFEISVVNDSGGFDVKECVGDFYTAKSKMYSYGNDAVVRHYASLSPTKIIAMVSGVAVSYPFRSGKNTTNIYQYINNSGKRTYLTMHREMAYFSTESYDNGNGKAYINITGFEGYIELKEVDLVPTKFINNQIPLYLGGNDTTGKNEYPFYTRIYQSFFTVVQNGNYRDLVYIAHSGWSKDTWPAKYQFVVGPAADWMQTGAIYYSYNGYDFYSDQSYKNKVNTYYSYYMFLPLRTKSSIPADAYNNFLSRKGIDGYSKLYNQGHTFVNNQNTYGVNAALVFAMACLESNYGRSRFAMDRNNLFGWSAFDSDPNQAATFRSIEQAIAEHMSINLRGFMDINDYRFFGMHLGNKGSGVNVLYAADPYWGYKIAAIAYELDKSSNNYNGNLTDFNKYNLGKVNTYNTSVYRGNSFGSGELFKTAYGATYQENYIVPILSQEGSFVKVQSHNGIRNDNSIIYHKVSNKIVSGEQYLWDKSIGYIEAKFIDGINTKINLNIGNEATGEFEFNISEFTFKDEKLTVSGNAYMPGIYVTGENTVSQNLIIYDDFYRETVVKLISNVTDNDKVNYSGVDIDLSSLESGDYFFSVSTEYSKHLDNNRNYYIKNITNLPEEVKIGSKTYSFSLVNDYVFMNIKEEEVEVEPTPTPDVKTTITQVIEKFEYADEAKTIVNIKGLAFISEINAGNNDNIKHQLILTNMETNERIEIDATTSSLNKPLNLNDGYEYSKIVYEANIDLKEIPLGEYTIRINVKNGETIKEIFLTNISEENIPAVTTINNKTYRFTQKQSYSYRYELSVYENGINYDSIKKPTRRDSMIAYEKLNIEKGVLNFKGVSWIYNINYKESDNPSYNLILLSNDGTTVTYPLKINKCSFDYTKLLNSKYDYSKTCFDSSIDLSELSPNTYLIYIENSNGEYKDIFEISDINSPEIKETLFDNKTYRLKFNNTRSRLSLTISVK